MWRTYTLFCIALIVGASPLFAQPCGLTDTLSIDLNSNPTYTYEVFDIFNDDLADGDQGVCGVEVRFAHQYVDNLVLTLTAPSGQSVTLIGPNTDQQFEFTFGSIWDISFVPCLELPDPDPGSLFGWDNNQTGNFSNLNFYNGSYYPYQGCLEDFNSGPANGTWTISIENDPSEYLGEIVYFRILFCDARGLDCCFADGGTLASDEILTCEGDTLLDIDPMLSFPDGPVPDTAIYGYTYLLAQDGIFIDTTDQTDLTSFAPGNYEICGLSYQLVDLDSLPVPDGVLTLDSIRDNLNGLEPRFCGEFSDTCIQVTIVPIPATAIIADTICLGDSLIIGDSVLVNNGTYDIDLISFAGCDSSIQVTLTVLPAEETFISDTLCPGQFIQVGGNTYNQTGTYVDTLTAVTGCDSIIHVDLTVLAPNIVDTTVTICQGESFAVGDSLLTEAGLYSFFLTSTQNCDSTLNITIELLDPIASIGPAFDLTCTTTSLELDGSSSSPSGLLNYQWFAPDGASLGTSVTQLVNEPGAYVLEVQQTSTNLTTCSDFDTIIVQIDTIPPESNAGLPDTLNCSQGQVTLGGISSPNPNHTYFWYTPDGNILGDVFQTTAVANAPGAYFLVVTDSDNRCSDTSMTVVSVDQSLPIVDPGTDTLLSCNIPEIMLDGSGSSTGPNFFYEWRDNTGTLIPGGNSLNPVISQGGLYQLMVENTLTNCRDSASVFVAYDTIAPRITLDLPDTLTCSQLTAALSGNVTSTGTAPVFMWSTTTGNIITPSDQLDVTVDQGAIYTLIATNTLNGCQDTASVQVIEDVTNVNAILETPDTINCTNPSIVLNGAGSTTGPNIEYTWSGSPQAPAQIDSFNATITLPGTYQLIVTDTLNFCADTVAAVVVLDTLQPFADAGPDRILTCDSTAVTLDGMNSSTGVQFDYDWIEIFGTGLVDTNSLQATVNSPGAYMLLVTNIQNGCFDTSFAIVNIDTLSPTASLATPLRLNCTVTEVDLDGTSSDNGPGFSFNWSTSGTGNFIEGTSTLTPTVNAGGFYQLEIRNDSTGCTDTAVIEVIQDTLPPVASAGPPALLNCNSPTVFLGSDDTSTGADILFNWSGPPGGISGSANDAFVEVTLPGTYVLLVRNSTTGCEASDSTTVTANLSFPTASAGPDTELDCNAPEVILDGSGSTTENTAIIWSGPCIIGDPSSLIVTANCDGLYVLSVTDTINGCTALDSVLVTRDPLDPNAILPDSIELSCETGTAIIDASASEGTSFSWLFDGIPISQTGLSFTADSAGIYTLIANNAAGNCPDTASVVTTLDCSPNLSIAPPDTLTCSVQAITLDATGSDNGPNITYEWLAPNAGCIESGSTTLQPVVRCPGTYQLIATNSTFGLSDTLSVVVPSNTLAPIAEAGPGDTLTCEEPTTILSAAGSTTGPGIGYTWTKLDDETFEKDSFSIFVNDASTYFLTVIDSTNGCFAEDIVVVQISDNLPDLNFSSTIIPCMQDSFWLQAFVVPQGPQYEYSWSGDIILDGADSISVLLDTAGMVRLTVTNPANNCSSFRDVLVTQQECVPCLDSIAADTLTCDIMQVSLNGSYCEPCTGCTVSWTTNGGNIVSNTDSLSITVDQPGFYTLTATDTLGFSTEITVSVIEQVAPPEISTTSDQILSCQDTVVTLEVFASGNNADLSYQWATTDGVLPSLDSLSAISVVHPGVYSITVRDQYTGCESTDTVNVTADTIPPIANAGPEQILTCDVTTVALDGSSSSFGSSILYEWSGPLTNIPGNNTFNPSVNIQGWYELLVTDTLTGCTALDSVFVAQNTDNPNIVPIPDTTISCTIPSVVLSGNLPDTTGFSTCWFLTDGNGDPTGPCNASLDFEVNSSGQYAFEVKNDTTGCTSSVVVNVTQDTLLPVLEVADTFFFPCTADSLNISAIATPAGALNYTWNSPDGFPITGADQETATVFQPGAYLVQVERTDNGCAQSQLIEVVDDPRIPEVIAGPDTLINCNNTPLQLNAEVNAASGQSTPEWSTADGLILSGTQSLNPQVGEPGWYFITVTDAESGCQAVDSTWVEDGQIAPEIALTNTLPLVFNCVTDSILADATPTMGGTGAGFTFEWRRGAFNTIGNAPVQWITELGDYRLFVQDEGSGCRDTLIFQIEGDFVEPIADIATPERLSCSLTSIILDGTNSETGINFSYNWLDSNEITIAQDTLELLVDAPGTYTLQIVDDSNGCIGLTTVIVESDADFPIINIAPPGELSCSETSTILNSSSSTGSGPLSFSWSTDAAGTITGPADQAVITVASEGLYILSLTDLSNGCISVDTIEITASSPLIEAVNWQIDNPSCPGDRDGAILLSSVTGGTSPFLTSIDNGALTADNAYQNLSAGTYDLLLEDANGCLWDSTLVVAPSTGIDIETTPDTTIQLGQQVNLSALVITGTPDSIWWWPSSGIFESGELTVAPTITTTYLVWAVDENGCLDQEEVTVKVTKETPVYAPTVFSPNGDGQNDRFLLYSREGLGTLTVFRVFDRWGNMVHEATDCGLNNEDCGWDGTFRGSEMDSDVFTFYAEISLESGGTTIFSGDVLLLR